MKQEARAHSRIEAISNQLQRATSSLDDWE